MSSFSPTTVLNPLEIDLTNINHIEILINEIESWQNLERKRRAWRENQILEGEQKFFVLDEIMKKFPDSWVNFRLGDIGLANKVIKKKNKAYKTSPSRELENKNETQEYQSILKESKAKDAFKEMDKIFNYWKYTCMWVSWLSDTELGEVTERGGRYNFKALKPYEYDLVRDSRTGEPLVFCFSLPDNDITGSNGENDTIESTITESQNDISSNSEIYAMWSKQQHVKVIKKTTVFYNDINKREEQRTEYAIKRVNEKNVNPFAPRLPIAFKSKDTSIEYPIENSLPDQSIDFNVGFSNLKTASDAQGHGQLAFYHPADQKVNSLHMGMHTAIDIPLPKKADVPQPKVEYINASPDLSGQLDILKFEIVMTLDEHDIKAKGAITGGVDSFSSGFDRLLSEADCIDVIEDNQSTYSESIEQDVFLVVKSGEEALGKNTFTSKEVAVKYPKPKVLISDKETIANIKAQKEEGLILPWEKHIIMNPNLTEKEAKKREKEIQKANEELQTAEATLQKKLFPEQPMIG